MTDERSRIEAILANAMRLHDAEDHVAAFQLFQQVHLLDPSNVRAMMGMGLSLVAIGQVDDAIRILDHAVSVAPDELDTRSYLVSVLYRHHRYGELVKHVDILIDKEPTNPHWYSVPARAYHALGQPDKVRHYVTLGTKMASRGIDYQAGQRHALPKALQRAVDRAMAKRAKAIIRERFGGKPSLHTWSAVVEDDGRALLRGAGNGVGDDWVAAFEIAQADDDGDAVVVAAKPLGKATDGVRPFQADADGLAPGETYVCRLTATRGGKTVKGDATRFTVPLTAPPAVETGAATPLGGDGATVNGGAGGSNLPTRTWFAWGTAPDKLSHKTPARLLPPARTLRAREVPYHNLDRWLVYALETSIERAPDAPADDAAADHVFRLMSPFGKDRNHLSGIGVGELVGGLDSALQPQTDLARRYAGDARDIRDAEVEMTVDLSGLDARDFLLSFWMHTYTGQATVADDVFDAAAWALTGQLVDPAASAGSGPTTIRFTLACHSDAWSFCGNNVAEQGLHAGRYTYHPLHETLADHRGNVVLMFLFGGERQLLDGNLDIHNATLRYRNPSLLAPGTPARLVEWPAGSLADPGALTGGWIGNADHYWFSGEKPKKPQEFVWDLGQQTKLEYLRLHQNPLAPAKRVEVWGATGKKFTRLWQAEMAPRVPSGVDDDPIAAHVLSPPAKVRLLKLRVVSGHGAEHWGLDAFEAFGAGAEPRPETATCTVCEDLADLSPGETIHYRLVAENAAGKTQGEVRSFAVPADARPVIHGAEVFRHDAKNNKAIVLVRMSAMGLATTLAATGEDDGGNALACASQDAGSERTPRHIACIVSGVRPGAHCRLTLTAENEAGNSAPVTVEWEAPA